MESITVVVHPAAPDQEYKYKHLLLIYKALAKRTRKSKQFNARLQNQNLRTDLRRMAKRIRKLTQVNATLQNQNLRTDLRRMARRIRKLTQFNATLQIKP